MLKRVRTGADAPQPVRAVTAATAGPAAPTSFRFADIAIERDAGGDAANPLQLARDRTGGGRLRLDELNRARRAQANQTRRQRREIQERYQRRRPPPNPPPRRPAPNGPVAARRLEQQAPRPVAEPRQPGRAGFTAQTFEGRPNQPHRANPIPSRVRAPGSDAMIDTTLHHVVPWNQLSRFAQTAAASGHHAQIAPLLEQSVATMMANSPMHHNERMQGALTERNVLAQLRGENAQPNAEAQNAIATSLAWMPGNLFHGPDRNLRSEDPGEGFEAHARSAVGHADFDRLHAVNGMIDAYHANPTPEGATAITQGLIPSARAANPVAYDANVWEPSNGPAEHRRAALGPLYRLQATPPLASEAGEFADRAARHDDAIREAEEVAENRRRALEEYQANKQRDSKEDDDDDGGGLGAMFG